MFQANQKEDQPEKEKPLHVMPDSKEGEKQKDNLVNQRAFFIEERVDDMSSVKLPHGKQVQGSYEKPRPACKTNRMQQKIFSVRQWAMNPPRDEGKQNRISERDCVL